MSLLRSLRSASSIPWRRADPVTIGRSFTQSSIRSSDVVFTPTSSPELDSVLTTILHKIILPARLPQKQRKLVMNEKFRSKLQREPIIIEVDGYEHRFDTLDFRNGDIPSSRAMMRQATDLMKAPEDWDNLLRLLSGYRQASRKIIPWHRMRIIRNAGRTGNIYAIIHALRNVHTSDFRLGYLAPVDEVLYWTQMEAIKNQWQPEDVRRAATWTQMVLELLEDESQHRLRTPIIEKPAHLRKAENGEEAAETPATVKATHKGQATAQPHQFPLHREPQVVAQALHMAAALMKYAPPKDEASVEYTAALLQVRRLASTLAHLWPAGKTLLTLHERPAVEAYRGSVQKRIQDEYTSDHYLEQSATRHIAVASFVVHACELALPLVDDAAVAEKLREIALVEREELQQHLATRGHVKAERGWAVYDALLAQ